MGMDSEVASNPPRGTPFSLFETSFRLTRYMTKQVLSRRNWAAKNLTIGKKSPIALVDYWNIS